MNKKILLVLILILVVVIGAFYVTSVRKEVSFTDLIKPAGYTPEEATINTATAVARIWHSDAQLYSFDTIFSQDKPGGKEVVLSFFSPGEKTKAFIVVMDSGDTILSQKEVAAGVSVPQNVEFEKIKISAGEAIKTINSTLADFKNDLTTDTQGTLGISLDFNDERNNFEWESAFLDANSNIVFISVDATTGAVVKKDIQKNADIIKEKMKQSNSNTNIPVADFDMKIYLKTDIPEAQMLKFKTSIESQNFVASVVYKSSAVVLEEFRRSKKDDPQILQALTEMGDNPMNPELVVKITDATKRQSVIDAIQALDQDSIIIENFGS